MSEHKITVAGGTSVRLPTAGKYCDRDIIVTAGGGTASEDLDEVLTEQEALIDELQDALRGKGSAWYDAFWDEYQENGNRVNGSGCFAGRGWKNETFHPKYPMKLQAAEYMFYNFNLINTKVDENTLLDFTPFNDMFDFVGVKNMTQCFYNARVKNLFVDVSSATNMTYAFASGNGGFIQNLTIGVKETLTSYSNTFAYQYNLRELRFTEDSVIAGTISFQHCNVLSKASMVNIVPKLSDTASGKTVTFSTKAVKSAFGSLESEEWLALVGTKPNWTFAYA